MTEARGGAARGSASARATASRSTCRCPRTRRSPRTRARTSAPIQVPIFSGFAAPAVVQRLQDSRAKAVITADYSLRRGTRVPMRETIDEALRESPSVEHVVEWSRDDGSWNVELGPGELAAARGRGRAPLPARVHVRHDRQAEGRAARARRLPALDRPRGGLPVRHPRGRPRPLLHRHGLDHGPVDGRRRRRARAPASIYMEGAPDWPARPALAARRGGARDDARRLADADPRADPEGRARQPTSPRCARSRRPASRGTPARTTG